MVDHHPLSCRTCLTYIFTEIQKFGDNFCPNYLATASKSAARASSTSTVASSTSILTSSSPVPKTVNVASTSTAGPSASATPSSTPTNLGAGMEGTNWHKINGESPDHNRGPAIEAVCISLFVIAASVVAFRCAVNPIPTEMAVS